VPWPQHVNFEPISQELFYKQGGGRPTLFSGLVAPQFLSMAMEAAGFAPERTTACPNCGREILEKALQCSHCRKWLVIAPPPERARPSQVVGPSRGQPLHHFLLLTVFSGGLYELYWFYRNWRDLAADAPEEPTAHPGLLTFGLLVPFVNVALVYRQLAGIHARLASRGLAAGYSPWITTCIYIALGIAANLTALWSLSCLMVLPLLPVQEALNRYWSEREPASTLRERLSPPELMVIACGAAAMVMVAALGFLGAQK
jgi:hypothetical protein